MIGEKLIDSRLEIIFSERIKANFTAVFLSSKYRNSFSFFFSRLINRSEFKKKFLRLVIILKLLNIVKFMGLESSS